MDETPERDEASVPLTRRAAMIGVAGLGLAGVGAGSGASQEEAMAAAAAQSADTISLRGTHTIGRGARARHPGAVVIGDSSSAWMTSKGPDEVRSQMPVHAPSFNTTSTRTAKTDLEPVDPEAVLEGVRSLPVRSWRFEDVDDGRHVGPMAEAFHDAFELGESAETIASVDADGVAMAAIQGLVERHQVERERLEAELSDRRGRIAELESRLAELEAEVAGNGP